MTVAMTVAFARPTRVAHRARRWDAREKVTSTSMVRRASASSDATACDAPNPSAIYDVCDEREMLYGASNAFAIGPDELILRCKAVLRAGFAEIADDLSEDFQFVGPVVGPLGPEAFVKAVGGFDLTTGFPDMKSNYYHFRVDPYETNRVWFTSRTTGTHTGTLAGRFEATGTRVECPPQALSMTFNEKGQVTKVTVGVVMDRTLGNTGGLGDVFGLFYAIGSPLPFPEAQPWKMSKRYKFFQFLGRLANRRRGSDD